MGKPKKDTRPVLLAMCNPHSHRPEYALWPYPPGCSGHRLLALLQSRVPEATHDDFVRAFDRRNLVNAREWDDDAARQNAPSVLSSLKGRHVVVLGVKVREALGLPELLVHPQKFEGGTYRQLPHPSGRCLWYNSPSNRAVAALLLEELYRSTL